MPIGASPVAGRVATKEADRDPDARIGIRFRDVSARSKGGVTHDRPPKEVAT
jgi:hypothetical protein